MSLLPFLKRHCTYVNVVSLVVIAATTTTSAYAAKMYTGKNIKDSSLTSLDFKDRSIEMRDLSTTARTTLKGRKGATGATGDKGAPGPQGDTGATGDMGKRAHSLVRYAMFHSPYLRTNTASATPNAGLADWNTGAYANYDYEDGVSVGQPGIANFAESFPDNDFESAIDNTDQPLLQLTGQYEDTTGTIRPTAAGQLNATATLTLMHTWDGDNNHVGGRPYHNRLRCTLRYANNDNALGAGSPTMGVVQWISSSRQHKVYTITLTGSEKIVADATANYNVGVTCADVDHTGAVHWKYVAGNITAHAVYVGA